MTPAMSRELREALRQYRTFEPYVFAWGAWSRTGVAEVPHPYRCPLRGRELPDNERPATFPLADSDALSIDGAFGAVAVTPTARALVRWLIVNECDYVTVFRRAHDLRRALRRERRPFSLPELLTRRRDLIEQARQYLIDA